MDAATQCAAKRAGGTAAARPARAALGNNAKSSSFLHAASDAGTGGGAVAKRALVRQKRLERFAALAQGRVWLAALSEQSETAKSGWKVHATYKCHHVRRAKAVGVHREARSGSAFYGGLATCGSVWACPVCAAKIQQKRRAELIQLIDYAYSNVLCAPVLYSALSYTAIGPRYVQPKHWCVMPRPGSPSYSKVKQWAIGPRRPNCPTMLTFTFPHGRFDSLAWLRNCMADAFARLRSGSAWEAIKERVGYEGLVRSTELTHGKHGWHLHTHEIWLLGLLSAAQRAEFLRDLRLAWLAACMSAGLIGPSTKAGRKAWQLYADYSTSSEERQAYLMSDSRRGKKLAASFEVVTKSDRKQIHSFMAHSVDARFNVSSSDYLAKQDEGRAWGADNEMASATSKKAKRGGVHPHEFLVRQAEGDRERYLEYVQSMHGASQLFWSHGLKDLVGVKDKTDVQLVREQTEKADVLGLLTPEQWSVVRRHNVRGELLSAAELGGWPAVVELLEAVEARRFSSIKTQLAGLEREAAETVERLAVGGGDAAQDQPPVAELAPAPARTEPPAPTPTPTARPPAVTPLNEWLEAQRALNPQHWATITDGETIQPRRIRLPSWMTARDSDNPPPPRVNTRFCPPGEGPATA